MINAATQKFYDERKERFVDYIKDGLTIEDIMDREGIDKRTAINLRQEVASLHGLTIKTKANSNLAFGLDNKPDGETYLLSWNLGEELYKVGLTRHRLFLAKELGLTMTEQRAATARKHNWTIAQIARLAKLRGVAFDIFLRQMLKHPLRG